MNTPDAGKWGDIVKRFETNNNKDGLVMIRAAALAGCPFEKVDRFMKENLPSEMLMEILLSIVDGVPEDFLKMYIENSDRITVEEMRNIRFASRNDKVMESMAESVSKCTEILERVNFAEISKGIKKICTTLAEIRNSSAKSTENSKAKEDVNQDNAEDITNGKEDIDDRKISEEASERSMSNTVIDYCITDKEGVLFVSNSVKKAPRKHRMIDFFKRLNKDKIVEKEKRSALVQQFVKAGFRGDKLTAFTEAVLSGVSNDFLKIYIDKDVSSDELRLYTACYLAIYDPETKYHYEKKVMK